MNSIYQEISDQMEGHFEEKRIDQLCATSLMEFMENGKNARIQFGEEKFLFGKLEDDKIISTIEDFAKDSQNIQNKLDKLNELVEKLHDCAPLYFQRCKNQIANCSTHKEEKRIHCQEKMVKFHQLNEIKNSWFFNFLPEEDKKTIESEIDSQKLN